MKPLTPTHLQSIKLTMYLIALTIFAFTTAAYTLAWTGPTVAPTGGNTSAPLNVTSTGQIKDGGITVGGALATSSLGLNVYNGFSLFGFGASTTTIPTGLVANFNGGVGASQYCDKSGLNCSDPASIATAVSNSGGVSSTTVPNGIATFTASGSWVAPAGVNRVKVRVWGGGAGGGAGSATANLWYGKGGGAGGYAESIVTVIPGNSYAITIGAGGVGQNNNDGTDGGVSRFSTFVTANGGARGTRASNSTSVTAGGTASGTISMIGGTGQGYYYGEGGNSPMGGQGGHGGAPIGGSNGSNASEPGGGGGGGGGTTSYIGGSGAKGRVVVEF